MPKKMPAKISTWIITGLMGCSALTFGTVGMPEEAIGATTAKAQSSWTVSRVASISQGSYCTMAQKYDDNSILSIARNINGEYSLALDFQSPVLKSTAEQNISLKAGSSPAKEYKIQPQSPQVIVIPIAHDSALLKDIEKSSSLTVDYSGGKAAFNIERFKEGQNELATCIYGLKNNKTQPSNEIAAKEASTISPAAESNVKEPSVEGLLAARPTPSMGSEPLSSIKTSAPIGKVEVEASAPVIQNSPKENIASFSQQNFQELQSLQIENVQLKKALAESRQEFENRQTESQAAAIGEIREKLMLAENENKGLKEKLAQINVAAQSSGKEENHQVEATRMASEIAALKSENTTLRNQLSIAAKSGAGTEQATATQLVTMQQENTNLRAKIEQLSSDLKLASVQKTNMSQQSRDKGQDESVLVEEIRMLKNNVETLQTEKSRLQESFEKLQKESESGQLKTVGGSWDLEQATRRYQESQREIRRLGALLDSESLKCAAEKKEIEMMLFDPEIAKGSQITKLNELEAQVIKREAKIKELEETITSLKTQENPEKDKEVDVLKANLAQAEKSLSVALSDKEELAESLSKVTKNETQPDQGNAQSNEALISTLKESLAEKNARLSAAEAKLALLQAGTSHTQQQQANNNIEAQKTVYAAPPVDALAINQKFPSKTEYNAFLKNAGITINGDISEVGGGSDTYRAYSWKTESLYGSVEMKKVPAAADYDTVVAQYLARAKSRCQGEFASVPSSQKAVNISKSSSYEIACVSDKTSSSASVLFAYGNGIVTTVAHEGRAEAMELAIDARDKVAQAIR